MEITALRKAMVPVAAPDRPVAPALNDAVATELPDTDAVTAADTSDAARQDNDQTRARIARMSEAVRDVVERRNILDDRTREVVYQAVNSETGEVVRQVPAEATLRLRAYIRNEDGGAPASGTRLA